MRLAPYTFAGLTILIVVCEKESSALFTLKNGGGFAGLIKRGLWRLLKWTKEQFHA